MSTMTKPKPSKVPAKVRRVPAAVGEARIVIRDVNWEIYDKLSDAVGEGQHVRMAYDGKDLEIMSTSRIHELFKEFLGLFVNEVATELAIAFRGGGETTWKRPEVARGLEADQCYYFLQEKLAADLAALKRRSKDIADYPNPDLAIEIDISPPEVDRKGIYKILQVGEIWRFDGEDVTIEQLGDDGIYVEVKMSRFLPIKAIEIRRWILEEDLSDQGAWKRRLRTWARRLARRRNPPPRRSRPAKGGD